MLRLLLAAASAVVLAAPAAAVPAPQAQSAQVVEAQVQFDPPLDRPLRYRFEKVEEKNGKSSMSWSVDQYEFRKAGDGYRLTVTPVSSGSGENDPVMKAVEKKLADLIARPYVLLLNSDGEITEFVDSERYWNAIFDAVQQALSENASAAAKADPKLEAAMSQFLNIFRQMPAEARLAKMTEWVQPIVEFGNTEWSAASPISLEVETASPFGPVKQQVRIGLNSASGEVAALTVRSEVPKGAIDAVMRKAFQAVATAMPKKPSQQELDKELAALEFSSRTVADYEVSTAEGLTLRFQASRTIEAREKGVLKRQVTTTSLHRID